MYKSSKVMTAFARHFSLRNVKLSKKKIEMSPPESSERAPAPSGLHCVESVVAVEA